MAFIYWIHLPEHKDILSEGYIGYTGHSVHRRFQGHLYQLKSGRYSHYTLYRALNKHGDRVIVTTLLEGSEDYCLEIEHKLRPEQSVGWNQAVGGVAPLKGIRNTKPWNHGFADHKVWAIADHIADCYLENPTISQANVGRTFNLKPDQIKAIIKDVRDGWRPREDLEWTEWVSCLDGLPETPWTSGMRVIQHVRASKRAVTEETKRRMKEANLQYQSGEPWRNPFAGKKWWALADYFKKHLDAGGKQADLLREFNLPLRGMTLTTIFKKIKGGWSPLLDERFQVWLADYKHKELHESALPT